MPNDLNQPQAREPNLPHDLKAFNLDLYTFTASKLEYMWSYDGTTVLNIREDALNFFFISYIA